MAPQQRNPSPLFVADWRYCFVLFLFDSVFFLWAPQQLNPVPFFGGGRDGRFVLGLQETPLQKNKATPPKTIENVVFSFLFGGGVGGLCFCIMEDRLREENPLPPQNNKQQEEHTRRRRLVSQDPTKTPPKQTFFQNPQFCLFMFWWSFCVLSSLLNFRQPGDVEWIQSCQDKKTQLKIRRKRKMNKNYSNKQQQNNTGR